MPANGHRRPARPQLSIVAPAASEQEAAAIAAALERFLAETAPRPRPDRPRSAWQQAALQEGVAGKRRVPDAWWDGRAAGL